MKYLFNKWVVLFMIYIFSNLNNVSLAFAREAPTRRHFYATYIGIDFGLINQFEVSPLIGYQITSRLHAGLGAKYIYHYDKRVGNVFRAHIFGPLAFTDFLIIKDLDETLPFRFIDASVFLHSELNVLSLPVKHFDIYNEYAGKRRFFEPTWLVGAGLRRHAGGNRYFHILFMVDVSSDSRRIYSSPVLRLGFVF